MATIDKKQTRERKQTSGLTEGMANTNDATDVTALALNRSDTKPAIMLPVIMYIHKYISYIANI